MAINMNIPESIVEKWFDESIETKRKSKQLIPKVKMAADMIINSIKNGGKVMTCGNGGSAADSQHIAAELVNKMYKDRTPLPAIALTTDASNLTSISNDYSFSDVFKKQVDALGKKGDVLIAISTSGNSENIIRAIDAAKTKGIQIIGLTGASGGRMKGVCDILLNVPSDDTQRIQETHALLYHSICYIVEQNF